MGWGSRMGKIKLALMFIVFLLCFQACSPKANILAKNGYFVYPEKEDAFKQKLNGEWEFYPDLGFGTELFVKIENKDFILTKVPSSWNSLFPKEKQGFGIGTYRLLLKVPDPNQRYYFRIQPPTSSYELYVNRSLLTSSGKVGETKADTIPKYQINYVSFQPDSYEQELLLVVSNYHHARGGFRKPIELGPRETIQNEAILHSAIEIFIFGTMLTMALFQLTIFVLRRSEIGSFYFSLFCFLTCLRTLVLDNFYIVYMFPNFSWEWMQKIDYISAPFMVVSFLGYLRSLYPGKFDVPKWIVISAICFAVPFSLVVLFTQAHVYSNLNTISLVFVLLYSVFSLFVVWRLFHNKKKDAKWIFFGSILLVFGSTHDLAYGNHWIESQPVLPFFLFIFFLFQSILLARRNARFYNSLDVLTSDLSAVNEKLVSVNKMYEKFVPIPLLRMFSDSSKEKIKRGDFIVKRMTVLSSDIRDFTAISETLSPEENFQFLNEYLKQIGPIVRSNSGFIEKYVGDAIFALFERKPEDALYSAIQMHQQIAKWNHRFQQKNIPNIQIGVGIHFGELMLGIIGEDQRIESAVLSDSMGVANSLESMTKKYGSKILLSLDALLELETPDAFPHRILDFIKTPAKEKFVGIAEILIPEVEENYYLKLKNKELFEESVNLFWDGDFVRSESGFAQILSEDSTDRAAALYLERTEQFKSSGPPPGFAKGFLA